MNKIIGFCATILLLTSCGKENEFNTDFGSILVVNASPSAAITTAPATTMNVYIDTLIRTSAPLAYRGNTGYLAAPTGSRTIQARPSGNATVNYVNLTNQQVNFNSASTVFIYDTTTTSSNSLRSVRLTDDLSFPASGQVKVRFLHLAVNAPAVDVTLLRTSSSTPDSVTLANQSYIGATPNAASLSAFAGIPSGIYSIRVKAAGTQTVVLQSTGVNLSALNGIYTLFAAGTAVGAPLTNNVIRHF
jgi:hypothetical protein